MTFLSQFAKILGIRKDQAEDALTNERGYRYAMSRRSFVGISTALVAGTAFGFYKKLDHLPWYDPDFFYAALEDDEGNSYERIPIPRGKKHWQTIQETEVPGFVQPMHLRTSYPLTFTQTTQQRRHVTKIGLYCADGHSVLAKCDEILSTRLKNNFRLSGPITMVPGVSLTLTGLAISAYETSELKQLVTTLVGHQ